VVFALDAKCLEVANASGQIMNRENAILIQNGKSVLICDKLLCIGECAITPRGRDGQGASKVAILNGKLAQRKLLTGRKLLAQRKGGEEVGLEAPAAMVGTR